MDSKIIFENYLNSLLSEENKSHNSINSYKYDLKKLINWLDYNSITISEITQQNIGEFFKYCKLDLNLSEKSTARMIASIKSFSKYLLKYNYLDTDPLILVSYPKIKQTIPNVISLEQIDNLFKAIDIKTHIGIRDRALLEIMYSSGLRISEVVSLEFCNLHLSDNLVRILGKGNKERLIPMNKTAKKWIIKYLYEVRSSSKNTSEYVFVTSHVGRMSRQNFWIRLKKYAIIAGIKKEIITPHNIRHAFATHMVNNGADLKSVQQLLGHSNLQTTQIYTSIANEQLKNIHKNFHPREKVNKDKK